MNSNITFEYLLCKYLKDRLGGLIQYSFLFKKHLFPFIGDFRIDTFNFDSLRGCYSELSKNNAIDNSTIVIINKIIYDAFNYAVLLDYIDVNPIKNNTPITIINYNSPPASLSHLQMTKIIDSAPSIVIKTAFSLGFKMGLTSLEILSLTWDNVDFNKHELTIINKRKKQPKTPLLKKNIRVNPIPSSVYDLLINLKEYQNCFKTTYNYNNFNFIISNDNGESFSSLTLSKLFKICCNKFNIYNMTFNQTRQYFAHQLFESGVDESAALKILGSIPFPPNSNPFHK